MTTDPEDDRKPLSAEQLHALRKRPDVVRRMLDLVDASERLITFAESLWHINDPSAPMVRGWAIEAIADHLEAVTKGQIRKLLINVPPGFSKSLLTNVFWPAWEWGPMQRPWERYVCTSYDQTLVIRDNLRCRGLLLSEEYQATWGDIFTLSQEQNTKIRFSNNKSGWKAAKAIGGLTGDRGSRFIMDDPQSVMGAASDAESDTVLDTVAHAMPTRVQSKDDAFVSITQRLRENDVSGFILAEELSYDHLCIPMHYDGKHPFRSRTALKWEDPRAKDFDPSRTYVVRHQQADGTVTEEVRSSWHVGLAGEGYLADPNRFPPTQIDELEKTMASRGGTAAIVGQLEQRPYAEGGEMFQDAWWRKWTGPVPANAVRCRGWDFASSENKGADWTVGVAMARLPRKAGFVIYDLVRFKGTPGKVRARVVSTAKHDTKRVHISIPKDPGPGGEWVVKDLVTDLTGYNVHNSRDDANKEIRAKPVSAAAEFSLIYIHEDLYHQQAEGMPEGVTKAQVIMLEHRAFPYGTHDDVVDGVSRAFGHLTDIPESEGLADDPISFASTEASPLPASIYEGDHGVPFDVE